LKAFVALTDFDWFSHVSSMPDIDELNFWQASGGRSFRALKPGEPFLFKLHSPHDVIVGGGFFAHSTALPVSFVWDIFGEKNGANSLSQMRTRIARYRREQSPPTRDHQIACILLEHPFFFHRHGWIPVPDDWRPHIGHGKGYDLTTGSGKKLWEDVEVRLQATADLYSEALKAAEEAVRYELPIRVTPRLGQASFRLVVTDAYGRRCAVTKERALPTLEATHIKPVTEGGPHSVTNGILFRADVHKLFNSGYVTITPDCHFEVSRRIREDFESGQDYYTMHGRTLHLPSKKALHPAKDFIAWHNENIFRR